MTKEIETTKLKTPLSQSAFQRLVMWFELRKKKKIIANIKAHMLFFGYDILDMTDEEIEEGTRRHCEALGKTGVSAAQAGEALRKTMLKMEITT